MKFVGKLAFAVALCIAGRGALAGGGTANNGDTLPSSQELSPDGAAAGDSSSPSLKQRLIDSLPPSVSEGLDVNVWGWLSELHNDQKEYNNYYDAEISLGVTKSFSQRFTLSAQGNFIDANGIRRGELEQGYASLLLNPAQGSILTVGKFNANFGIEGRDFWNRTTGTTSLLFGAQPQDLVGVMLTLPIGDTGIKLRPFLTEDFQGQFYFNQSPNAGMNLGYQPTHDLSFGVTGMTGPGFVLFGGRPIHSPYPRGDYGDDYSVSPVANWQGPNLFAESGGTMYFVEVKAAWQIRPDLRLSAEFLQEHTRTSSGSWGWYGFLAQADYDLTDRLHCFARWSYLDDHNWLVTGVFQRRKKRAEGSAMRFLMGLKCVESIGTTSVA